MSTVLHPTTTLPTGTWKVDATHSQVGFAVDYMVGTFRGTFSPFDATLSVTDDGSALLEGSAPVSGVRVQDERLAGHLQTPDFFDAERTPEIHFRSTAIDLPGEQVTINGDLTIRGETLPVVLNGTVGDPADDPYGGVRFVLRLEGTIDRTAFGVNWNNPLPNGDPALANEVTLTAELNFVRS
jgi:polyisoprenoid-binding protein YceI